MDFLLKYVAQEKVERIVVGHPKQMNNEDSENMKYIKPFVAQLKKKLPDIPVELVDERFTSVLAHQAMLDGGLKKKARRGRRRWWTKSVPRLFCNLIWNREECNFNKFLNNMIYLFMYTGSLYCVRSSDITPDYPA